MAEWGVSGNREPAPDSERATSVGTLSGGDDPFGPHAPHRCGDGVLQRAVEIR